MAVNCPVGTGNQMEILPLQEQQVLLRVAILLPQEGGFKCSQWDECPLSP